MKKKIVYIVGTRPELIRSALIISYLKKDKDVAFTLVHTGQHYDYLMDKVFFDEFKLPEPDINLKVGSGSHAEQTAKIMINLEKFLISLSPNLVVVFGDTNSSLAGALVATKLKIPLAHLEAGCREWEMDMPEEINRRLIDHCSNFLFPVSKVGEKNLKNENIQGKVFNCGDPLYEVFKNHYKKGQNLNILDNLKISKKKYILLTTHRADNVDDFKKLENIITNLFFFKDYKIIFPIHPRTKDKIKNIRNINKTNLLITNPVNYKEILYLISNSKLVITDSGGLQKEAYWLKIPCITLRKYTGWIETVQQKVNFLCNPKDLGLKQTITFVLNQYEKIIKKFTYINNPYKKDDINKNIIMTLKKVLKII